MNYRRVVFLFCALSLFGFGCRPGWNDPYYQFQSSNPPSTKSTSTDPVQNEFWQNREQGLKTINRALQNLSESSTFRASIKFPGDHGFVTGVLELSKTKGLHGTLQAPGPVLTEIYAVDNKILFKTKGTGWLDVSGTKEGQDVKSQLTQSFLLSNDRDHLIADAGQIQDMSKDRSGCMLYTFETADSQPQLVSMCIKDNYPSYVMTLDQNGKPSEIRYWDFNKNISFDLPAATVITTATSTATSTQPHP